MEHRRPDPRVAGDTHVAGPAPKPPVMDAPGPAKGPRDTTEEPHGTANEPHGTAPPPEVPARDHAPGRLLDPAEADRLRERWREVQSGFVDDPGEAVSRADGLASDAVDALGHAIAAHRRSLAERADKGGEPDTERLRLALRGYRDLLDRIVGA